MTIFLVYFLYIILAFSCSVILVRNYQIVRLIENAVTMGGNWQKALSREM